MSPAREAPEIVRGGLSYPEGPIVLDGGVIAFVETGPAQVTALRPDGSIEVLAVTGGGPNGLTLGADGHIYVAQNGIPMSDVPFAPPSVQRFAPGGAVEVVATTAGGLTVAGPNDLAFGPDGRLYVTDPARVREGGVGRLFAFDDEDGEVVVELDEAYINGVGFGADGSLLWAESYDCFLAAHGGLGGRWERLAQFPNGHLADGFAVAEDGRVFVATCDSHGIWVVDPAGGTIELIELDDRAVPTNCCFEGTTLWVTDYTTDPGNDGRLWRVETDAVGMALHAGTLEPAAG